MPGPTLATPWTVAHQVPLSMGFPRQEYWSGLPFPFPGYPSDPGIESALGFYIGKRILYHRATREGISYVSENNQLRLSSWGPRHCGEENFTCYAFLNSWLRLRPLTLDARVIKWLFFMPLCFRMIQYTALDNHNHIKLSLGDWVYYRHKLKIIFQLWAIQIYSD